jgi:hypothetical protein
MLAYASLVLPARNRICTSVPIAASVVSLLTRKLTAITAISVLETLNKLAEFTATKVLV